MNDFENYWERCIRELGIAAQDTKAVARWCFENPPSPSITCHVCGRTSYNLNDILYRYCGHCHRFIVPKLARKEEHDSPLHS